MFTFCVSSVPHPWLIAFDIDLHRRYSINGAYRGCWAASDVCEDVYITVHRYLVSYIVFYALAI